MLLWLLILFVASGTILAADSSTLPYDVKTGQWLFDAQGVVSRNDVLYTTPSVEPWEAMPTGGGDLSAMVRCDGSLHLHLSKSDAWGFQASPDAMQGTRFFNNVSPGHVRIDFGRKARTAATRWFRQRLDLFHGQIVIHLGNEQGGARLAIWGHPSRKILVVEVIDPSRLLDPAKIVLSEWRATMKLGCSTTTIYASEIQPRPARPHLASTGMQDYFDGADDPLLGRGTAVALATPSVPRGNCAATGLTATIELPKECPYRYHVLVAAAVTTSGDPLDVANRELKDASDTPLEVLKAEHRHWWCDYWSKSFLRLSGSDRATDWLCAAYHVHLYSLGCVNRGPYPAKWDGGAGLMVRDRRNWGLSEWVQELRFTYLPLYAANRLEMARGLPAYYSGMAGFLAAQTRKMWGMHGLWIPETVLPWGTAEEFAFKNSGRGVQGYFRRWDPKSVPYGRFELYNPYVGFLFTSGLEICHHYLTYYRYSGDETFLRDEAYPIIRGVCLFLAGLLNEEADGRYHLDPANALETWWMVRDPTDTLDGIRAVFPDFIRMSKRYGRDAELCRKCEEILAALPDVPRELWTEESEIRREINVYAPAAKPGTLFPERINRENPALYRLFPFGVSGIGAPDYDLVRRTYLHRLFPVYHGWSMDAIWAARLGLGEDAYGLLCRHAAKFNRFRYGGWDSNDNNEFPGGLAVVPFTDAAGLSAYTLNEMLLQSHGGVIRVVPAVPKRWSGIFRLRAEGGFLIASDFRTGVARFVEIRSLLGKECVLDNPWWPRSCRILEDLRPVFEGSDRTVTFKTHAGHRYLIEPVDAPLAGYRPSPVEDKPNHRPGMPGRD